jgi:glycolate oxidase FAD binding subunit
VETLHPPTRHDVVDVLRAATADRSTLLTVGGRRHIDKGNPTPVDAELWTTQLDRIVAYDPEEMICVVEAGMRVGDLRRTLLEGRQEWAVDAPDDATVGGVIAAGVNPWRVLRVGPMRDTVVRMRVVTGDGRLVKSGAATVKNVTGYDVHRLLTGSLGTLGVIVEVALKVRPLPKAATTLVAHGGDGLDLARRFLRALPLAAAIVAAPRSVKVRLEGWAEEVREQSDVAGTVAREARVDLAPDDGPFPGTVFGDAPIVAEPAVVPSLLHDVLGGSWDWLALAGVGTAWVPLVDANELAELRARTARAGGVAPVIRGPGGLGVAELPAPDVHRRLKTMFDPGGVLAPGRAWGGI